MTAFFRHVLVSAVSFGIFIALALVTGNPWYLTGLLWVTALLLLGVWLIRHPRKPRQQIVSGDGSVNVQAGRDLHQGP